MQNNLVYQNIVRTFASLKQECRTWSKRYLTEKVRCNSRTLYQEFPTSACITSWIFLLYGFCFLVFNSLVFVRPLEITEKCLKVGYGHAWHKLKTTKRVTRGWQVGCGGLSVLIRLGATFVRTGWINASRLTQILVCDWRMTDDGLKSIAQNTQSE